MKKVYIAPQIGFTGNMVEGIFASAQVNCAPNTDTSGFQYQHNPGSATECSN